MKKTEIRKYRNEKGLISGKYNQENNEQIRI